MHRIRFVFVLAAALALTGCVPLEAPPEPAAEPTFTPVFASDEEALAAAEEAYAEYLRVLDDAFATGSTIGLEAVAVGEALTSALRNVNDFTEAGSRLFGRTGAEAVALVASDLATYVQIYACLNVSGVEVTDKDGASLVQPGRPHLYPVQVNLTVEDSALRVEVEEVWSGRDFCQS